MTNRIKQYLVEPRRLEMERDSNLVQNCYDLSTASVIRAREYERCKEWFENKWERGWEPEKKERAR